MILTALFSSMLLFIILVCIYKKYYLTISFGTIFSLIFLSTQIEGLTQKEINNFAINTFNTHSIFFTIIIIVTFIYSAILVLEIIAGFNENKNNNLISTHIINEKEKEYLLQSNIKEKNRYFQRGLLVEEQTLAEMLKKEEDLENVLLKNEESFNDIKIIRYTVKRLIKKDVLEGTCFVLVYNNKALICYN